MFKNKTDWILVSVVLVGIGVIYFKAYTNPSNLVRLKNWFK